MKKRFIKMQRFFIPKTKKYAVITFYNKNKTPVYQLILKTPIKYKESDKIAQRVIEEKKYCYYLIEFIKK